MNRRHFLVVAASLAASPALAQREPNADALRKARMEEAIRRITGGASMKAGRVKLDLPPLVDNGNTVPVTVTVQSPMTAADHVKAIHVLTEKNPQPYVFSANLGPRSGRASVATRMRIADSGVVMAIAQMSDGSFWTEKVDVVVTLSACIEDGLI